MLGPILLNLSLQGPTKWALQGTVALDPTFGSFTLLEPVSHIKWIGFFGESVSTI
jgi:hypothetical protein